MVLLYRSSNRQERNDRFGVSPSLFPLLTDMYRFHKRKIVASADKLHILLPCWHKRVHLGYSPDAWNVQESFLRWYAKLIDEPANQGVFLSFNQRDTIRSIFLCSCAVVHLLQSAQFFVHSSFSLSSTIYLGPDVYILLSCIACSV